MNNTISEENIRDAAHETNLAVAAHDASAGDDHIFSESFEAKMNDLLFVKEPERKLRRFLKPLAAAVAVFLVAVSIVFAVEPNAFASFFNLHDALYKDIDLDSVYVAEIPEACLGACDHMRYGDPEHGVNEPFHSLYPIAVRVRVTGEVQNILNADKQHYVVEEVFRGEGIKAGDVIMLNRHGFIDGYNEDGSPVNYIYTWNGDREVQDGNHTIIEMRFSNLMVPDEDYLVFISGLSPMSKGKIKTYDLGDDLVLPASFSYNDLPSTAVSTDFYGSTTYVRYSEVMGNQFFGTSQKVLDELEALRKDLIALYPIGSGK